VENRLKRKTSDFRSPIRFVRSAFSCVRNEKNSHANSHFSSFDQAFTPYKFTIRDKLLVASLDLYLPVANR
jgi:hypothetical protein